MKDKNKILACLMGLAWAGISIYGSQRGFAAEWGTTHTDEKVMSWLLALLCHAAQMVMVSRGRLNWSLILSGLAAYVYSIYTNAAFIHSLSDGGSWALPLAIGFILDVLPEPLINWACGGDSTDIVSNISAFWAGEDTAPVKKGR